MARKAAPTTVNITPETLSAAQQGSVEAANVLAAVQADYSEERDLLNQLLGQAQMAEAFSKFSKTVLVSKLAFVKENKLYQQLAGTFTPNGSELRGTWAEFCNLLGISDDKANQHIANLQTFGEEALEQMQRVGIGYRDLRQFRRLPLDQKSALIEAAKSGDKDAFLELAEEIIAKLAEIRSTVDELFIVDDLNNLCRGGRLSNASAFIGSLLNIKPLLTFNDEAKIVAYDKVRSMKRAVKKIEQEALEKIKSLDIPEDKLRILIIQSNDAAQAEEVMNYLKAEVPKAVFEMDEFSPVIATYLGEKSIGITWMIDVEQMEF